MLKCRHTPERALAHLTRLSQQRGSVQHPPGHGWSGWQARATSQAAVADACRWAEGAGVGWRRRSGGGGRGGDGGCSGMEHNPTQMTASTSSKPEQRQRCLWPTLVPLCPRKAPDEPTERPAACLENHKMGVATGRRGKQGQRGGGSAVPQPGLSGQGGELGC